MLAERVPGLLPDLDLHDALEVSAVHSLAGFNLADELITRPPYSDPHHSASVASIVGGGQRMARPGAISCAHKGVLFLDDSTEPQSTHQRPGAHSEIHLDHPKRDLQTTSTSSLTSPTLAASADGRLELIALRSEIEDVERLRRHFRLEAGLGHSWGGLVEMDYATRHPARRPYGTLCSDAFGLHAFRPREPGLPRSGLRSIVRSTVHG
jgi:hypothetical protein